MPFATSSDHPLRTLSGALALLAACALPGAALADWRPTLEAGTEVRDGNASQRLRGTLSEPTRPLTRALGIEFIRDDAGNTLVLDGSARYWVTRGAYGLLDTRYLYDEALGIDGQVRALIGPGYRWQSTPAGGLGIELGAGYAYTRLDRAAPDENEGEDGNGESIGVLRIDGFRNVLDRLRVDARLEAARTPRLDELRGEIGLALNLGGGSVRYTLQGRRLTPEDGDPREETHAFVSFGYRF